LNVREPACRCSRSLALVCVRWRALCVLMSAYLKYVLLTHVYNIEYVLAPSFVSCVLAGTFVRVLPCSAPLLNSVKFWMRFASGISMMLVQRRLFSEPFDCRVRTISVDSRVASICAENSAGQPHMWPVYSVAIAAASFQSL